jgi:hypothetical protein
VFRGPFRPFGDGTRAAGLRAAEDLLDVLYHFFRVAELIEVVEQFPFPVRSDQIGQGRVIDGVDLRICTLIVDNLVIGAVRFGSLGELGLSPG